MNLLSKLLPPKIAEALAALVGVGLTYAIGHYGGANTWVQLAVAAASVLGVGTVANTDALSARRAAKAAAKTASTPKAA